MGVTYKNEAIFGVSYSIIFGVSQLVIKTDCEAGKGIVYPLVIATFLCNALKKLGRKNVIGSGFIHNLLFYPNIYDLFLRLKMKDFTHNIINDNPDINIINLDELAHKLTKIFP